MRFPAAQTYWARRDYMLLHPHREFQEAASVAVLPASVSSLPPCQADNVLCTQRGSPESYAETTETLSCKLGIKTRLCYEISVPSTNSPGQSLAPSLLLLTDEVVLLSQSRYPFKMKTKKSSWATHHLPSVLH